MRRRPGLGKSKHKTKNGISTLEDYTLETQIDQQEEGNDGSSSTLLDDFADQTLQPSFLPLLIYYISQLVSLISAWYFLVEDKIWEMALGITRWFGGDDVEEGDDVKMEKMTGNGGGGGGKKVKRRRRKDATPIGDAEYYPGMVNLSGVLCYMNSVLQSLASVTSLISHLDRITALAVETDLPTPVTDALTDILTELNTPHSSPPRAIRPHALISALHPLPQIHRLLSTREQQDAHELFVVLAEAISDESLKVAIEVVKVRGMAELLSLQAYCYDKGGQTKLTRSKNLGKDQRKKMRGLAQPWEGLIARRRVCRSCGWSTEVRMDTLGGMELPIPMSGDCTLDSCIAEYLAPELLSGVTCEMCSLRQTLDYYRSEVARLSLPPNKSNLNQRSTHSSTASGSFSALEHMPDSEASGAISEKRKRKAKDAKKVETRLQEMFDSQIISDFGESTIPLHPNTTNGSCLPIKWQKVNSDSIREGIVTRPPQTLRLHINRSGMTPYGQLVKKSARVAFPLLLDLTRFVANGVWEERSDARSLSATAANAVKGGQVGPKVLYRLESVILHYGYTTSSGHFTCIRRKPVNLGEKYGPVPTKKSCPDASHCESCRYLGPVRTGEHSVPGRGWLQISDDEVEEVGEEALMGSGGSIFMLFYEKVGEYQSKVKGEMLKRDRIGDEEGEASQTSVLLDRSTSSI